MCCCNSLQIKLLLYILYSATLIVYLHRHLLLPTYYCFYYVFAFAPSMFPIFRRPCNCLKAPDNKKLLESTLKLGGVLISTWLLRAARSISAQLKQKSELTSFALYTSNPKSLALGGVKC